MKIRYSMTPWLKTFSRKGNVVSSYQMIDRHLSYKLSTYIWICVLILFLGYQWEPISSPSEQYWNRIEREGKIIRVLSSPQGDADYRFILLFSGHVILSFTFKIPRYKVFIWHLFIHIMNVIISLKIRKRKCCCVLFCFIIAP